ncbi:O-fucosyltransferase family protein [Klebsormidium nitens]|uniref:O-fucosyltransferase family protein n=1 Tax=Klebsormidium nitens TaxID=105231 RepID=A0A1Y1IE22_KLENI|nr:O-fucosyltransferase family protein [Klebsormidium nitens]|eukprot:GAQ88212.1 O-fucosyltransferase family protein [Klebsormidium nitens]
MSRLGKGEDLRRDAKETFREMGARGKGTRGRRLGIQILFVCAVVLCSGASYYATSVRLHRSSQVHSRNQGTSHPDRFQIGNELSVSLKTPGQDSAKFLSKDGVEYPIKSFRGSFTLPWDDWPPQQVHSLFFAHKELPRTEEFDREELGILRELERAAIEAEGERRTGEGFKEAEEGNDATGGLKAEGGDIGGANLEHNLEGRAQVQGVASQSESRVGAQSDSGDEQGFDSTAALDTADETADLHSRHASVDKLSRDGTRLTDGVQLRGERNGEQVEGAAGRVGLDDERGDKDRQLRVERGVFESPPDLYDAISDEGYHQCVERDPSWAAPPAVEARGYLFPALDGGLSQQIFEIANTVVIARILNVTLVVPEMRADAFWKDGSDFESIFDLQNFKSVLSNDIRVVTMNELPASMRESDNWIYVDRVQDGLPADYVSVLGDSFQPGNVTFLYSMWAALNHVIDPPLEKLRCCAKYQALRFSPTVVNISNALQARMRKRAGGPFLAIHLRFEVDMVMHQAGCDYGIDDPEEEAFWVEERKRRDWPEARPDELMRRNGYCPPTPEEIGKWLQGLGFNRSTQVYLASGKAYHEDVFLPPFLDMFPNTFKKEDLLTEDEKIRVKGKNNLLAAIDFGVLAEADVVALTFHGVMKLSIQGHRSWNGFHKTLLYPNWESWNFRELDWETYRKRVAETTPVGRPSLRTDEAIVEVMGNPIPECMCRTQESQ